MIRGLGTCGWRNPKGGEWMLPPTISQHSIPYVHESPLRFGVRLQHECVSLLCRRSHLLDEAPPNRVVARDVILVALIESFEER